MAAVRVLAAATAVLALAVPGAAAAPAQVAPAVFTGYGFDACTAPSLASLHAWSASPYRAVGIYLGGVNRACPDGNLSADWVNGATALGWSLLPLYVGLQAPCVSQSGLAKLAAAPQTASAQGAAAALDAAAKAAQFDLPSGSPVYLDMEGYAADNAACSQAVQAFVGGWVTGLRAAGLVPGVYGSAASTIRDVAALSDTRPDVVWIANWNGVESVFGDPYVSDSLWADHQRVHQYRGGHKETWGGVTISIDNDYADGLAVAAVPQTPVTPPPAPAAGQVNSGDGLATVTWPASAFTAPAVVTLTPTSQPPDPSGYGVQLVATDEQSGAALTSFAAPLTIHLLRPATGLVPVASADGATWQPVPQLTAAGLSASVPTAYSLDADGTVEIQTLVPGYFGLLSDTTPPSAPTLAGARLVQGELILAWGAAQDNSGRIASYQVLLDGTPVASLPAKARRAVVRDFHPAGPTVYRIRALDPAGNVGAPTSPAVVVPTTRPSVVPRAVPRWAFTLLAWQRTKAGPRPAAAPRQLPRWYWTWATWRATPFRLARP